MLKVFSAGGRGAGECMVLQVLCDLLTLGLRNIHAAVYFLHFFFQWLFFSRVILSFVAPCLPVVRGAVCQMVAVCLTGRGGNASARTIPFPPVCQCQGPVAHVVHRKINMEPNNGGFENDFPFQLGDF